MATTMLALAGALVLLVTTFDALVTTLGASSGAGPLTSWLVNTTWRALRPLTRSRDAVRMAAGPIIVLVTVGAWILGLWAGWTLVFSAGAEAVVSSTTGEIAALGSRVYYAGYTLFTLGNGGYQPNGLAWELLTPVSALNGLFLVTLSITYLLPVVTAATERRQQAAMIAALGLTPEEIVASGWDGSTLQLDQPLLMVAQSIQLTAVRHQSYPVLHFFGARQATRDFPPRVVALAEAVSLLRHGVKQTHRPHPATLSFVDESVDQLLAVLDVTHDEEAEPPPPAELGRLRRAGVPTVEEEDWEDDVAAERGRRLRLARYLERLGIGWDSVARVGTPA